MDDGAPPRSIDDIFEEYKSRRAALVKALTTEIEQFLEQCDPEKEELCLYGHANGNWEVTTPPEDVPTVIPQPALGINFERDLLKQEDWVALIAIYSDSWLLAVAFHKSGRYGFEKTDRKNLFDMINELPTIFEVTSGTDKKRPKGSSSSGSKKTKSNSKEKLKYEDEEDFIVDEDEEEEDNEDDEDYIVDEEEDTEALCGTCLEEYSSHEFWICCDFCETWYHGKCVEITPPMAKDIKKYKCPMCKTKRSRS